MEPLLGFIGSYWWLGFVAAGPIVGVLGSVTGWWREGLDGLIVLTDAAEGELKRRVAGELEA